MPKARRGNFLDTPNCSPYFRRVQHSRLCIYHCNLKVESGLLSSIVRPRKSAKGELVMFQKVVWFFTNEIAIRGAHLIERKS